MKLSNKALKELKRLFPTGWARILQERISEKHERTFSTNYIRYVLDGKNQHHNEIIVQEAYSWFLELKDEVVKAESQILNSV